MTTPTSSAATAPPDERPTRVRFVVLTYLCLLAFVLYLDRICISQAGPAIKSELGISDSELGVVFASFTIAYGLFMTAAGRLGDRFGSRRMLVAIVIWWSAFTALTGACTGLVMLVVVRFVFGAGEAGAFPNCARILNRWFPAESRGLPQGLMQTAALIGGAVAPFTVAYTMHELDSHSSFFRDHFGSAPIGWRWTFLIFGLLGVAWAIAFRRIYHDDPHTHPRVNAGERAFISRGRDQESPKSEQPPVPWSVVLTSRNVWLMGFIISCSSFVSYFYFSWLPIYMQSGLGLGKLESGEMASLVLAGGAAGSLAGGFLSDWLTRRTGGRKRVRSFVGFVSMGLAGLTLLASLACRDPWLSCYVIVAASFLMMVQIASWWGAVSDISGKHTATLFGLMNSLGVIGGAGSQLFCGWLADMKKAQGLSGRAQWDPALYYFVAVLFIGSFSWLFVDSNKSAVEAPETPASRRQRRKPRKRRSSRKARRR